MSRAIRRFIARHRRAALVKGVVGLAKSVVRGDANFDYDPDHNGERFVAKCVAATAAKPVLFDVGANTGDWTKMAVAIAPNAQVHAFEILPATYAKLLAGVPQSPSAQLNGFGLSDSTGEIDVAVTGDDTRTSSVVQSLKGQLTIVKARVTTGDEYCAAQNVTAIDLLKIDVEGAEPRVLRGFDRLLSGQKIRAIQFEYGRVSVHTKFLLKDFYEMLEPLGYTLGKIYPNHIAFAPYQDTAEDFIGPNYLAVLRSETQLIKSLRN